MSLLARFRPQRRPGWAAAPDNARVLADAPSADGSTWLLGTRTHLVAVSSAGSAEHWPWEQVQAADWDAEERRLRVSRIGSYGEQRAVVTFVLTDPDRLLQLLRERITASIVYQRHVLVTDKRGFRAIGRRSPGGGEITWMCDLDPGVDPETPGLEQAMASALEHARAEIGA